MFLTFSAPQDELYLREGWNLCSSIIHKSLKWEMGFFFKFNNNYFADHFANNASITCNASLQSNISLFSIFCSTVLSQNPDIQFPAELKPPQKSSSLMELHYYLIMASLSSRFISHNQLLWWSVVIPMISDGSVGFSVKQKADFSPPVFSLASDCVIMVSMPICVTPHQNVHTKEAFYISKQLFQLNYLLFTFSLCLFFFFKLSFSNKTHCSLCGYWFYI